MNYYITYRMVSDQELHIVGPYNYFEYSLDAMQIISQDGIYDLDIVNEMAMDVYNAYKEVEDEYEQARKRLKEYPGAYDWSIQDEVNFHREYINLSKEMMKYIYPVEKETKETLSTIETLESIEKSHDPYDFPF